MNEEESIVGDVITGTTGVAGDIVGGVTGVAGDVVGGVTGGIGSGISTVSGGIGDAIGGPIGGVVGGVGGAVGTVIGGVGGLAGDVIGGVGGLAGGVIGGVGGAIGGGVDAIADGLTGGVPDLPSAADIPPLPGSGGDKDPCNRLDYIKDRLGGAPLIGNLSLKDMGVNLDGLAVPKLPKKLPSPGDIIGDIGDGITGGISDLAGDIKSGIGGVMEDLSPGNLMASAKKAIGSAGRDALAGAIESGMSDMLGPVKGGLGNQLKRSFKTNMLMLGVSEVANIISGEPNILDPCAGRGKEKIKGLTADSIGAAKGGAALAGIKGKLDSAVSVENLSNKQLASAQTAVLGDPKLPDALDKFKAQELKQSALFEEKTEEVIAEVSKETADKAIAAEEVPTPEVKAEVDLRKFAPATPPPTIPLFVDASVSKPQAAWKTGSNPTPEDLLSHITPMLEKFKDSVGTGKPPIPGDGWKKKTGSFDHHESIPEDDFYIHTHDDSLVLADTISGSQELVEDNLGFLHLGDHMIAPDTETFVFRLERKMGKYSKEDMRGVKKSTRMDISEGKWKDQSRSRAFRTPNRWISLYIRSQVIEMVIDGEGKEAMVELHMNLLHTDDDINRPGQLGPINEQIVNKIGAGHGATYLEAYQNAVKFAIDAWLDDSDDEPNWRNWFDNTKRGIYKFDA